MIYILFMHSNARILCLESTFSNIFCIYILFFPYCLIKFINSNESFVDICKDKWLWEWLMRLTLTTTTKNFSKWCQKIRESGWYFCALWRWKIKYGNNSKTVLHIHSGDPDHLIHLKAQEHVYQAILE